MNKTTQETRVDTHSWSATFPQCRNNPSMQQRAERCPQVYSETQNIIRDEHSFSKTYSFIWCFDGGQSSLVSPLIYSGFSFYFVGSVLGMNTPFEYYEWIEHFSSYMWGRSLCQNSLLPLWICICFVLNSTKRTSVIMRPRSLVL